MNKINVEVERREENEKFANQINSDLQVSTEMCLIPDSFEMPVSKYNRINTLNLQDY